MMTHCYKCDSELLPQDDVESPRYKQFGCLQCQVSIAAEHRYGGPTLFGIPVVTVDDPELRAAREALVTEAEALLILNRISDAGATASVEELLLAKRLIQHFHVCDFGYLLTELDDRQRRSR